VNIAQGLHRVADFFDFFRSVLVHERWHLPLPVGGCEPVVEHNIALRTAVGVTEIVITSPSPVFLQRGVRRHYGVSEIGIVAVVTKNTDDPGVDAPIDFEQLTNDVVGPAKVFPGVFGTDNHRIWLVHVRWPARDPVVVEDAEIGRLHERAHAPAKASIGLLELLVRPVRYRHRHHRLLPLIDHGELLHVGVVVTDRFTHRIRDAGRMKITIGRGRYGHDAVRPVVVAVVGVDGEVVADEGENEQRTTHAESQSRDVDEGVSPVFTKVAEGNFEVVAEHGRRAEAPASGV